MKNNKGFASSFLLFGLLILFLIIVSILLFTLSSSSSLNSKIKTKLETDIENPDSYTEYNYYYTGDVQMFTSPRDRTYIIQAWSSSNNFSKGSIFLKKGQKIFIYVGKNSYNGGDTDIREIYGTFDDATSQASTILKAGYNAASSLVSDQKFSNIVMKNASNLGQDTNPSTGSGHVRIYYNSITAKNVQIDANNYSNESLKTKLTNINCSNTQCILDEISYILKGQIPESEFEFGTYIESSGTQYINTGYIPSDAGGKIEAKFNMTSISSDAYGYIYGVEKNASPYYALLARVKSGTLDLASYTTAANSFPGLTAGTDYTITQTWVRNSNTSVTNTAKLNNTTNNNSVSSTSEIIYQAPLYLFAANISNSASRTASMKLYYLKIYDSSNTLVRDYVPARRNNQIGLYDKVGKKFYLNVGSGTFTFKK